EVFLRREQLVFAGARQFIKRGGRFRGQHRDHGVVRKFGHLDRDEMHSHLADFREGGIVEFSVVLCSCARRLSPLFPLFSLLLLLGSGGRVFLRRLLLLFWFLFSCGFYITAAHFSLIHIIVPI